jgi:hypothetical protein
MEVENPLKNGEICRLFNKKADINTYYIHTYDPTTMIAKVRDELHLSKEVISRFDSVKRDRCCNVVSITLYVTESYCTMYILEKYLYSIHRSVKNVLKKLPGWIVRVYFDTSVEECVTKEEFGEFNDIFNAIKDSPNVEIYTYDCPSFKKGASGEESQIPIARTRTLRFLPLSDPEVNFCVVREADGIVSNLDCHNIKMFTNSENILFYLPLCVEYLVQDKFDSYSDWLRLYKIMFGHDYFNERQSLNEFLAGTFCCRLKLKRDYYQKTVITLQEQINDFFSKSDKELAAVSFMADTDSRIMCFSTMYANVATIISKKKELAQKALNIGFDEILLLEMYKELICVETIPADAEEQDVGVIDIGAMKKHNPHIMSMLMTDNVLLIKNDSAQKRFYLDFQMVYNSLLAEGIIYPMNIAQVIKTLREKKPNLDFYFNQDILYYIDALLLGNIVINVPPFNIKLGSHSPMYVSELLNVPYNPMFDLMYDSLPQLQQMSQLQLQEQGGGKRKRRFSRKIKKQSYRIKLLRMRNSR